MSMIIRTKHTVRDRERVLQIADCKVIY